MQQTGIYEFVFGALATERDDLVKFWEALGFHVVAEGTLSASSAASIYGHEAALTSLRLEHSGCRTFGTGFVRLQLWSTLLNEGLARAEPLAIGSRWMGLYTRDILEIRDSLTNAKTKRDWHLWTSPLVSAPLAKPAPEVNLYEPFVGLREQLVFGPRFRLAFIQRGGFDRPGFGTFDETLPYKNTEGSHANIVQPANQFSTEFYKQVLGLETAPYGEAHDSGDEPPTQAALSLDEGQTFRVERIRAPDCPAGLLQVYSPYWNSRDLRDFARPGSGNLCCYSYRVADLDATAERIAEHGGSTANVIGDEFGHRSLVFRAPDGISWIVTEIAEG